MEFIATLIHTLIRALILLVIIQALLSFFMDPYHPIRQRIDSLVEPMLAPIRRIMPRTGMLDFSPLVLIILLQVIDALLAGILRGL